MKKRKWSLRLFLLLLVICLPCCCSTLETPPELRHSDLTNDSSGGINSSTIIVVNVYPANLSAAMNSVKLHVPLINMTMSSFMASNTKVPHSSSSAGASFASSPSSSAANAASTSLLDAQQRDLTIDIARRLEGRLKAIRNDEMCIADVQQMFDSMEFVQIARADQEQLQKMAKKLEAKMNQTQVVLQRIEEALAVISPQRATETVVYPCPARIPSKAKAAAISYNRDQIEILNNNATTVPVDDFSGSFYRQLKVAGHYHQQNGTALNIKRQYLLSPHDNAIDNSCPFYYDTQPLRNLFVSSIPHKQVLILLDHGNSLNADQLELTKSMAKHVIALLSETDSINIIAVSDKVTPFYIDPMGGMSIRAAGMPANGEECDVEGRPQMHKASIDNKLQFYKFIESLNKTKEATNHSIGFQHAFDFIRSNKEINQSQEDLIFLYISRGLLSLAEAKTVLETIATGQSMLKKPIVINTCAIIIDEKRIMYERQFLRDISVQDYNKYNIETATWLREDHHKQLLGQMLSASKRESDAAFVNATALFSKYYQEMKRYVVKPMLSLPYVDLENKDIIISVSKALKEAGAIGIDLYLQDLAEDILYYNKHPDSYAFLLNHDGLVLVHPTLVGKMHNRDYLFPTDVLYLEQNRHFDRDLRQRIVTEAVGQLKFTDTDQNETISYTWRHTMDKYFIICIVTRRSHGANPLAVSLKRIHSGTHYYSTHHDIDLFSNLGPEVVYHRLDLMASLMKSANKGKKLIPPNYQNKVTLCRNFKQISTFDSPTLYLSPSAFQSPFLFTKANRNSDEDMALDRIQTLMAYLKDRTNLLANPGLLPQVRNDVMALSYIINHLKRKHLKEDGPLKKYIIRRYVATVNGVLEVFPGVQLDGNLEPMQRPWFVKAMSYPGKVIITEPYLDAGGAGFIVSIAYTIFEGKPNALHNPERDVPIGVISIDTTLGFLYKMLLDANAVCSQAGSKCFITDDKGYLLAHPSILDPLTVPMSVNGHVRKPLEHVTQRESFVANDIVNHKVLVQKQLCNVYANRTTQRYYQFNTSMVEVLTNIVHGERSKYHIALVPGTNVFVTVLNSSNEGGAFCPCNTVDRLCLNCNRMEQTECECPCECPLLNFNNDRARSPHTSHLTNGCQLRNETVTNQNCDLTRLNFEEYHLDTLMPIFRYDFDEIDMRACANQQCEQYVNQMDCLGVIGCEWCQVDVDGETVFNQPFCTAQASCFNGVLGSITPYGLDIVDNQLGATIFIDPLTPPTYSSIGPIAGAIIALCLVVGFAMYCYRQNQDPHQPDGHQFEENFYVDSTLDNKNFDVPLNRMNYEDDNNDGNNSNQNLIPVNNGLIHHHHVDASPYRAPSAYRRPNGDSDHGYSTMTPHDDSENMCFTLADPLLNAQKRASISDSASINTSVSSPTNYQRHYNVPLDNKTIANVKPLAGEMLRDTGAVLSSQMTTSLSSPHHVLAPVTVHRQMEGTTN